MKRLMILLLLATTAQAANEIRAFCPGVTTAYAMVREIDGDVWYISGQVFEAYGTGGRTAADYDIALTDESGDMFVGDMDTNISAGTYYVTVSNQVGGAAADTDPVLWYEYLEWSGTAVAEPTPSGIADAVWDEVLTGATHNIPTSAGRRVRELATNAIISGTAQGPGTGNNQIQLDTDASTVDGSYDPSGIVLVNGTGVGQSRLILQYTGSTKTATVDRNWKVNPDATSEYVVYADPGREHVNEGLAQAGTSNTITLNALASSADDAYNGQMVFIRSGTGDDQARIVEDYNGVSKLATVHHAWNTTPDSTSAYSLLPGHWLHRDDIADSVWDEAVSAHTTETTFGGELGGLDPNLAAVKAIVDRLVLVTTTVASATDANDFVLSAGTDVNDIYEGCTITVLDVTDGHYESRLIEDWSEGALAVTVDEPLGFTPAAADSVWIWSFYFPRSVFQEFPLPRPTTLLNVDHRTSTVYEGTKTLDPQGRKL
jgi:hypothetical protein